MPKRYRVEVTDSAEGDAFRIYEFIKEDSPSRAARWYGEIERQMRTLARFPRRCPVIPESAEIGVEYRHLIFGNYRTVFRIEDDTVWIVRIIHGAQLLDISSLET